MNLRIVVADERQANFFDTSTITGPLQPAGSVHNPNAGLKDTDLESDRPGRRYGGTSGVSHGGAAQQSHHHGVDGEHSTERHDVEVFAKSVVQHIDSARTHREFDKLLIVAPAKLLGMLREWLPGPSQALLAGEVSKDILHHGPEAILKCIPDDAFFE